MAIRLEDPERDRLVREVAALTGETLTEAVRAALQNAWAASGADGGLGEPGWRNG